MAPWPPPQRRKTDNPYEDVAAQSDNPYENAGKTATPVLDAADYGQDEALGNSLLAGFGDEVRAALKSKSFFRGPEYGTALAREEAGAKKYAKEHPVKNLVGEVTGMAIPAVFTGGTNIAGRLGLKGMAAVAANQGALGAIYGAGYAPKGQRLKGAGAGTVAGGVFGGIAHGGLKALRLAAELIPGVNTAGRALRLLPKPGEKADQLILKRLGQDKLTPQNIGAEAMSRPNTKPETLLDLGGENTTSLGKLAVNSPGKGRQVFKKFVAGRQENTPGRISEDITTAGMNPVNKFQTVEELIQHQKDVASPLYEKALSVGAVNDPDLSRLIEQYPELQAARVGAENIARQERLAAALRGEAVPAGTPEGAGVDARTLHRMKLALDKMVKFGYVPPGGDASTKNYASKEVAAAFRKRIGEVIPGYDEAATKFADEEGAKQAFEAGTKFLREDAIKSSGDVARMTPSEKDLYRLGAGTGIRRAAETASDGSDIAKRVFGSPEKRAQIAAAIDDPQAFAKLSREMAREQRMAEVNRLQGGSQTQPMAMEGADAAKAAGILSSLVRGNVGGAAWRMTQRLGSGMTPEVTDAVSSRLMSGSANREELMSALAALTEAQRAKFSKSGALGSLIAAMSGQVAGSSIR